MVIGDNSHTISLTHIIILSYCNISLLYVSCQLINNIYCSLSCHLCLAAPAGQLYADLASAAESGWDFSTRWFKINRPITELDSIATRDVVPVDLNAFLCWNARLLRDFSQILGSFLQHVFLLSVFILCHVILCYTMLCCIILCYIIILYCIILRTILYYTISNSLCACPQVTRTE